jgi:hypothetical protein
LTPAQYEVARQSFALRLLADFALLYPPCAGLLLKKDAELAAGAGAKAAATPAAGAGASRRAGAASSPPQQPPARGAGGARGGGLFRGVMERQLAAPPACAPAPAAGLPLSDTSQAASYFLLSVCVRSAEARRRVLSELAGALGSGGGGGIGAAPAPAAAWPAPADAAAAKARAPFVEDPARPPPHLVSAYVGLASSLLSGSAGGRAGGGAGGVSLEVVRAAREAGLVCALTRTLRQLDLEHPAAPRAAQAVLRALEVLTRVLPARGPGLAAAAAAALAGGAGAGVAAGAGAAAAAPEATPLPGAAPDAAAGGAPAGAAPAAEPTPATEVHPHRRDDSECCAALCTWGAGCAFLSIWFCPFRPREKRRPEICGLWPSFFLSRSLLLLIAPAPAPALPPRRAPSARRSPRLMRPPSCFFPSLPCSLRSGRRAGRHGARCARPRRLRL